MTADHGGGRDAERDERGVARPVTGGPSAAAFAGVGFQFAAALVLFYYLGQWLDRRLGTGPVFVLLCVLVGSGAAFYSMYRQLMGAQRRADAARAAARAREGTGARDSQP